MSEKSKPSTGAHAELSKISETSSPALRRSNLGPQLSDRTGDVVDDVADRPGHRVEHLAEAVLRVLRCRLLVVAGGRTRVAAATGRRRVGAATGRCRVGAATPGRRGLGSGDRGRSAT